MFEPGHTIDGRFRVVRTLGRGGLGTVYEVEHLLTGHRRALKMLTAPSPNDPALTARFLREASAATRIGNAHIVESFDAGTLATGEPYVVMELLKGQSLREALETNGRLSVGAACEVVVQACEALAAAHDAHIVHRDVKPDNLFLVTRDGKPFVKVLDFGISKFSLPDAGPLTQSHMTLGTPLYMAPEQMRQSKDVDPRADVYSLGVILWELLTGQPPYRAESFAELAHLVFQGRVASVSSVVPEVPEPLSAIIAQAMAVDREQRTPTARVLADAVRPFATGGAVALSSVGLDKTNLRPAGDVLATPSISAPRPVMAPPASTATTRRSLIGGLILVACIAGGFFAGRSTTPAQLTRASNVEQRSAEPQPPTSETKPAPPEAVVAAKPLLPSAPPPSASPEPRAPHAAPATPERHVAPDAPAPQAAPATPERHVALDTPPPAPPPAAPKPSGHGPAALSVEWHGVKEVGWSLYDESGAEVRSASTAANTTRLIDVAPGTYVLKPASYSFHAFAPVKLELSAGQEFTAKPPTGVLKLTWAGAKETMWKVRIGKDENVRSTASKSETRVDLAPGTYELASAAMPGDTFAPLTFTITAGQETVIAPPTGTMEFRWSGRKEVMWEVLRRDGNRLALGSTGPGVVRRVDLVPGEYTVKPAGFDKQAFRPFGITIVAGEVAIVDL